MVLNPCETPLLASFFCPLQSSCVPLIGRQMPPNPVTNAPFEASLSPEEVEASEHHMKSKQGSRGVDLYSRFADQAFRAQYPCDEDQL